MIKVRILENLISENPMRKGQIVHLPDDDAKKLIRAKLAIELRDIENKSKKRINVENRKSKRSKSNINIHGKGVVKGR